LPFKNYKQYKKYMRKYMRKYRSEMRMLAEIGRKILEDMQSSRIETISFGKRKKRKKRRRKK